MSISEADDCSHDEASKLVLENSNDQSANRKKKKERKSVRISEEEITFYPIDDSGYTTNRGDESSNLLEGWSEEREEESKVTSIVDEWTEEVYGNDKSITEIELPCLESRDNPFIPGGSLDQEASDILKRATIIRDQFFLKDGETERPSEQSTEPERTENVSDLSKTCGDVNGVTEDTISPQNVNSTQALPGTKLNGKLEDKNVSMESQSNDNNLKDGNVSLKDKKKQKKCCSVM